MISVVETGPFEPAPGTPRTTGFSRSPSVHGQVRRGADRFAVPRWKLDRLGRSLIDLKHNVEELRRLDIRLVATSQGIDTMDDDAAKRFLVNVLGAAAEYEHELIVERTVLGLDRVRKEESTPHGQAARRAREKKAIGRPSSLPPGGAEKVKKLRASGASWSEVAKALGCSPWAAMMAAAKEAAEAAQCNQADPSTFAGSNGTPAALNSRARSVRQGVPGPKGT